MPSDVEKVLRNYQDAFDGQVELITDGLARHWVAIEENIRAEMSELAYLIAEKRDKGEVITQQMLWKQERYRNLLAKAEQQISKYNQIAESLIDDKMVDSFMLGVNASNGVIGMEFGSVGQSIPFFQRIDVKGVEAMYAFVDEIAPLRSLLKESYPTAVDGLTSALIEGMARGFVPAQVAKKMAEGFGMGFDRALLIAQTEMARAYRSGQTEQYRKSGVVEYYVRFVNKYTACLACIALDGEKFELADDLYDHPRGCCNVIAKVKGVPLPEWEKAQDWLKNQPEEKQLAVMGRTRFELWKDGKLGLSDMVGTKANAVWGNNPYTKTLKELGITPFKSVRPPKIKSNEGEFPNKVNGRVLTADELDKIARESWDDAGNSTKTLERFGTGDHTLGLIYEKQNFDKLPTMVSQSEYKRLVKEGKIIPTFRGVPFGANSETEYIEAFKRYQHFPGHGIYGNGTYLADGTKSGFDVASSYATNEQTIMNIGVMANSNIIEYIKLLTMQSREMATMTQGEELLRVIQDSGRYAASKGYDAIRVSAIDNGSPVDYIILLNRSASVVTEELIKP